MNSDVDVTQVELEPPDEEREPTVRMRLPMRPVLPFVAQREAPPPAPAPQPPPASPPYPVEPALLSTGAAPPLGAPALPGARRSSRIGAWVPPGSAPGVPEDLPGSALAASNAAAGPGTSTAVGIVFGRPEGAPAAPAEVVELLWLDPAEAPRIRAQASWKKILADTPQRDEGGEPRDKRKEGRERRDALLVLRRGEPLGAAALADALAASMADGSFTPALVLTEGVVELVFDDRARLEATLALVTPFAAGDKKLKELVDTAGELVGSPWFEEGTAGLETTLTSLREAFARSARGLPAGHLEARTERLLLEQRRFQKRTLLGQTWIRASFTPAGTPAGGGAGAGEALPAYLPEALSKELPLFVRFKARLMAELRVQLDQYEASATALRVVALSRLVTPPRR